MLPAPMHPTRSWITMVPAKCEMSDRAQRPLRLREARRREEGVHLERRLVDVLRNDVLARRPLEERSFSDEVEDLGPRAALENVGEGDARRVIHLLEPRQQLAEGAEFERAARVGPVEQRQKRRLLASLETEERLGQLAAGVDGERRR